MKIDKIDVQTSNKKHKTDIAMLVDKQEFLQELQRLREKWQLKEPQNNSTYKGILHMVRDDSLHSYSEMNINKASLSEFKNDVDNLLNKFKRGKNFRIVVLFALFTGSIPEGVYQSCYFDVVTINEPEDMNKPENYQCVIVLSPRTELNEVKEAFQDFVKYRAGKIKFHQPRISMDSPVTEEFTNAMECIKREQKICDEKISKNKNNSEEINRAISNYLENTEEARQYMLQIGELHIDIPEHKALIEQFHPGNIYDTGDAGKFRGKPDIDRIRELYWMRYGESFNDNSKEPQTYKNVYFDWMDKCPEQNEHKDKASAKSCQYCNIQSWNNIEVALKEYKELLSLS